MIKTDPKTIHIIGDRISPDAISRDRKSNDIRWSGNPEIISLLVITDKINLFIKVYGFLKFQILRPKLCFRISCSQGIIE